MGTETRKSSDAAGNAPLRSNALTGAILAGGKATRYGGAHKGLETLGGRRIIDRVYSALFNCCDDVILIANNPDASSWLPQIPLFSDVVKDVGSLGGIHAALSHASNSAVLVVAWDMPFVPLSLLREMRDALSEDVDAVIPSSGSPRGLEPLCAIYRTSCLDSINTCLAAGDLRAVSFHDRIRLRVLPGEVVARHGDPQKMFMNVNSTADLAEAKALFSQGAGTEQEFLPDST